MANIPLKQNSFLDSPVSIRRLNAVPIDGTTVWFSLEEAKNYAKTNPTAYVGQLLSVLSFVESKGTKVLSSVDVYKIDKTGDISLLGNGGSSAVVMNRAPSASDLNQINGMPYPEGSMWIDASANDAIYILKKVSNGYASWVSIATTDSLSDIGAGDMLKADYALADGKGGYLKVVKEAAKVSHALFVGNKSFNGSEDITIELNDLVELGLLTAENLPKASKESAGVVQVAENSGLTFLGDSLSLITSNAGIIIDSDGKLALYTGGGLTTENGKLEIAYDNSTLSIVNGKLTINKSILESNKAIEAIQTSLAEIAGVNDQQNLKINDIEKLLAQYNVKLNNIYRVEASTTNGYISIVDNAGIRTNILVYRHPDEAVEGVGTNGHITAAERFKLNSLTNFELKKASLDELGGVKVGSGLNTNSEGRMSVVPGTSDMVGGVKSSALENAIMIRSDGTMEIVSISASKITGPVAEAKKTSGSLTIGDKKFDGSADVTITAEELGITAETLPKASKDDYGVVKAGKNVDISDDGTISVEIPDQSYTLPQADEQTLGGVKIGSGIIQDNDGTINVPEYNLPRATSDSLGGVKSPISKSSLNKVSVEDDGTMTVNRLDANRVDGKVSSSAYADQAAGYTKDGELAQKLQEFVDKSLIFYETAVGGVYKIKTDLLPDGVDEIIEGSYNTETKEFLVEGVAVVLEAHKIYLDTESGATYRYSGTQLVAISNPIDYASRNDAESGTDNSRVMTPLRTKQAIKSSTISLSQLDQNEKIVIILDCGGASD